MPSATRQPPSGSALSPDAPKPRPGRPEPRGLTVADLVVVVAGVAIASALPRGRGMPPVPVSAGVSWS